MKTKIYSLLILLNTLLIFGKAHAQNFTLYGDKTFGGDIGEVYPQIIYTGNNQFILAGTSGTYINGDKTDPMCDSMDYTDIWILKFDTSYTILWNKSLGGSSYEQFSNLIRKANGNFIFAGHSQSDSSCEKTEHPRSFPNLLAADYWIGELDLNGNKIWDKTLGADALDIYSQVTQLSSGNIIVAGTSNSNVNGDKTVSNYGMYDYWVVGLDSTGNKLWDKVYGGTLQEQSYTPNLGFSFSLLPLAGNNFILAGTTSSQANGNISDSSRGIQDIWIVKIDSAGNKIWDKRYGGSSSDYSGHIISTNDNGFILCGTTASDKGGDVSDSTRGATDVWVIKLDSLGNKQWDKRYGGNDGEIGAWIEKAPGGGYWVAGSTFSTMGFDVSEPPYGYTDYWIFKIDSAGNKLWDKRFGGPAFNKGTCFAIMPDSSIYFCGSAEQGINAVKTDTGKGDKDYWVVHFKYTDSGTGINESNYFNALTVFPNPTTGVIYLKGKNTGTSLITIYNLIGEQIYSKTIDLKTENKFDFSFLIKGMYFIKVENEKFTSTVKFIKE